LMKSLRACWLRRRCASYSGEEHARWEPYHRSS
jgi:hypothetical protein